MTRSASRLPDILKQNDADILRDWVKEQLATLRPEAMSESSLREQTQRFFGLLRDAVQSGELADITGPAWTGVREMLTDLSQSRATFGYTPSETAMFVLSLKQPLFTRLRQDVGRDAEALADEVWTATLLLDKLALFTTEVYQKGREALISRQQHEMLELSTPVVQLWDNVLALPLIGTLDSARTQVVMENLLHKIVDTGAAIAIIDTTAEDRRRRPADGRRLHHQRDPAPDRADDRPPGRRAGQRGDQGDAGRRLRDRAAEDRSHDRQASRALTGLREMDRIPILRMNEFLLVTIQVDMHDRLAMTLQDDLTEQIVRHRARGVLIDISSLEVVDSFIGRMIGNIAAMSRVLDAETVVVGMRPAVAITLVELGLSLPGVRTALSVDKGMDLLRTSFHGTPNGAS